MKRRLLIQWFHPWNSVYFGVQIQNCTWFLFRVRHTTCEAFPDIPLQWRWRKFNNYGEW